MMRTAISPRFAIRSLAKGGVGGLEFELAFAVSSPHRADAFAAGEWLIDELKRRVPIWKQEHWADGSVEWVHPASGVVGST